jgi:hypothetical protein
LDVPELTRAFVAANAVHQDPVQLLDESQADRKLGQALGAVRERANVVQDLACFGAGARLATFVRFEFEKNELLRGSVRSFHAARGERFAALKRAADQVRVDLSSSRAKGPGQLPEGAFGTGEGANCGTIER